MKPDISIVICTRNRCESLKKVLESLFAQEHSDYYSFEVIIIDNNSQDGTKEVIEEYIPKFNGFLRYYFEERIGISFARNMGIQKAVGSIIVFTDDDCLMDRHWVRIIYECSKENDFDAIGGRILPIFPPRTPAWVKENIDLLCGPVVYHDYGVGTKKYGPSMIQMVGANMAFKREVFEKYGLFRTDIGAGSGVMGEDTEFFNRLAKKTNKIYYCGQAVVWHPLVLKRIKLMSIARWNMAIAKYRFIIDEKARIDKSLTYYFGIPRYLIKGIIVTSLSLIPKMLDKREFLRSWISLSQQLGRMTEIRKRIRCAQSA